MKDRVHSLLTVHTTPPKLNIFPILHYMYYLIKQVQHIMLQLFLLKTEKKKKHSPIF
jgi:hypothetical protein